MKSCTYQVSLVLTALALLGLAGPGRAQQPQPPKNVLVFAPKLEGKVERVALPLVPAVEVWRLSTKGEAAPLGPFTFVANVVVHFGVKGELLSLTDGVGAFVGNNGDAIFCTFSGLFQPAAAATPNAFPFDAAFFLTGGAGKYEGVVGSGRIAGRADLDKAQFCGEWVVGKCGE